MSEVQQDRSMTPTGSSQPAENTGKTLSRGPGGNAGGNIPGAATATEAELLTLWRAMDGDQQADLLAVARGLAGRAASLEAD